MSISIDDFISILLLNKSIRNIFEYRLFIFIGIWSPPHNGIFRNVCGPYNAVGEITRQRKMHITKRSCEMSKWASLVLVV